MKKINIILTAAVLSGAFAAPSFAVTIISSTWIGGGVYSPSAKVGMNVTSLSTTYAATSAHLNGTVQYGTGGGAFTGDPSKIVQKAFTATAGATVGVPEAPASASALTGTWQ